jgi:hypothetical protein
MVEPSGAFGLMDLDSVMARARNYLHASRVLEFRFEVTA